MKKIPSVREIELQDTNVGFTDNELARRKTFLSFVIEVAKYYEDKPLEQTVNRQLEEVNTFIQKRLD